MVITQKTPRREQREKYIRWLLSEHSFQESDIDKYLHVPQAALEDKSIMDLIYSGDYAYAVSVVERLVEDFEIEDFIDE